MQNNNTDPRKGLPSASSFERRVHCPASLHAEAAVVGTDTVSEVAVTGSAIAAAIASADFSALGLQRTEIAERLDSMNKQALEDWKKDFNVTDCEVFQEVRFWLKSNGVDICSAQVDFAAVSKDGKFCLVVDDKSGFKDVTRASSNWQLRVALVAMDQQTPLGFEKARVAIAQYRMGEKFHASDYAREDIEQSRKEIIFYCRRLRPDAERTCGDWCIYCRAKAVCAEHAAWAMMPMVRAKVLDVPKKGEIELRVAQLPVEALAFIESRRTAANNLFSAVTARLKAMSEEQLAAVGLELKPSGSLRSIPDTIALWQVLVKSGLLTQDKKGAEEFRSLADINITRMDELLVTRLKLKEELSTKDSEIKLRELLAPVTKFTPKSPTLKPIKL